jgi:hypothetical protein
MSQSNNPGLVPDLPSDMEEPMTGAQTSYLKTLSEQAHQDDAFHPNLTKAEASKRIDALKRKLKLDNPHAA